LVAIITSTGIAWYLLHRTVLRRARQLTSRARLVARYLKIEDRAVDVKFIDLAKDRDDLGVLARAMELLVKRVHSGIENERRMARQRIESQNQRAEQAMASSRAAAHSVAEAYKKVGHEISLPARVLKELLPGNARADDAIERMYGAIDFFFKDVQRELVLESFDIVDYVRKFALNQARQGVLDVAFATSCDVAQVVANRGALEDVLGHLLKNALRFRLPGTSITLGVGLHAQTAVIQCSNVGPHIPNELLPALFSPGARAPDRVGVHDPDAGRHMGLGLFMAHVWVNRMEGSISAANVDGGVTFEIRLRGPI
jgi:signal transduction histidine kinase